MKKLQIFVWAAALLTLSFQVRAQTPEEIKQVENYLNGIQQRRNCRRNALYCQAQ